MTPPNPSRAQTVEPSTVRRVLVLATANSYRSEAFEAAARKLGVSVVRGVDAPPAHAGAGDHVVRLDFRDVARAVRQVRAFARRQPLQAVIPTDDAAVALAAHAAEALGLKHNAPQAAEAALDKARMRQLLAQAGLPHPPFAVYDVDADAAALAASVPYPCVVKPTCLSGSRGVIRADDPAAFQRAFARVARLLAGAPVRQILVEGYLPGDEYALEGLLDGGQLRVLALFDKPDPLVGPYFEETLYVTPSRAPESVQASIVACAANGARALGLREGAVHAEVRVNEEGAWLLEAAGRSIGGLCAQTLRFAQSGDVSLEEVILRQALGLPVEGLARESQAGGVMMIPIPAAGVLVRIGGLAEAAAVPGIESVEITARLNYPLVPLPEGESYLGFIFARGASPQAVEAALRAAHARLAFDVQPDLTVTALTRGG